MTQVSKRKKPPQLRLPQCCGKLAEALDDRFFKALGDRTRLHILVCIAGCDEPQSVNEVARCCSVDFSVVSRHLKMLHESGILDAQRQGRFTRYSVRHREFVRRIRQLADALDACRRQCHAP